MNYHALGQEMIAAQQALMAQRKKQRFDTQAVHGLYDVQAALANQGSVNEPLFLSPAQIFENSDHMETALAYQMPSWTYSRIANPSLFALENTLALLEGYGYAGAVSATLAGSGMAAIHLATQALLTHAQPGTNFVASASCYGGTFMLFSERYGKEQGIDVRWVRNNQDLAEWEAKIDHNTRFLFTETPSNPILAIADIPALAKLAHQHGLPLLVDSTIATPALQRPIVQGADVVIHSVSKALTSSGMVIAGAVIARHNLPARQRVAGHLVERR
ncbi:MAG TPA: aminotransferase class I/II-fold pyridoxal phosphate-dependent enzyme, partial [Anaerolineales bacterium]|nr:aminotransferase class I/II-fold pyridoxal phosphate-dependent enzyme [Anaerolineales bacterium]